MLDTNLVFCTCRLPCVHSSSVAISLVCCHYTANFWSPVPRPYPSRLADGSPTCFLASPVSAFAGFQANSSYCVPRVSSTLKQVCNRLKVRSGSTQKLAQTDV
eukprot:126735-Pelagomonas_calceolata.AAC.1